MTLVRRAGTALLRSATVNRAVRALARLRGHRLILVYHRLGPVVAPGCEIVPSVPVDVFRTHLQALGEVVDLVTLDEILDEDGTRLGLSSVGQRPAVALTFDDDLPSHVSQALPALREFGVPAAFFLSGRALHGRGAYWFQHLEVLLVAQGRAHTAALLGLTESGLEGLIVACEGSAELRRRVDELAVDLPAPEILQRGGIAGLTAAGMTVGFHTVDHDILPRLNDAALDDAVRRGGQELAAAAGAAVRYFAYRTARLTQGQVLPSATPASTLPLPVAPNRCAQASIATGSAGGSLVRSAWTICSSRSQCVSTASVGRRQHRML